MKSSIRPGDLIVCEHANAVREASIEYGIGHGRQRLWSFVEVRLRESSRVGQLKADIQVVGRGSAEAPHMRCDQRGAHLRDRRERIVGVSIN